jgi:hypothetical protein
MLKLRQGVVGIKVAGVRLPLPATAVKNPTIVQIGYVKDYSREKERAQLKRARKFAFASQPALKR